MTKNTSTQYLHLSILFTATLFALACKDDKQAYIPVPKESSPGVFSSTAITDDADFLGSESCKECHKDQFEEWEGSHHDKAMQLANRETILAKFEDESFKSQGVTSRFFQKDNEFYVNTEGPDGQYHDYKIVYTFGITPLQQYIVQFPNGRYQCLRTAWDTQKNKWFDLYPDFKVVHSEWLHWTNGAMNWNNMCSNCHSTNVRKNYNPVNGGYNTEYSIINVSCEACHGPGKQHVNNVKSAGIYDSLSSHLYMTERIRPRELVDECARCHMRREQITESYNHKGTMLDHYFPQLIESPTYYPDGQILDEDYVYGSFIQSKMYQNNVACNNCHDVHSLKLKFDGNKLCLQCHAPTYDDASHHHHKAGNEGTKCINCHMPGKFYMGNDFRRDHSFRIPRPDQSLTYNTPNACTQCHTDKTDQWAWNNFKKNWGTPDHSHFSEKLAPGIAGVAGADIGLLELANDRLQPEIARASAVTALANYNIQNNLNAYIALLNDDAPLVRGAALDFLGKNNSTDIMADLLPLLNDPKRSIRVKAFYALGAVPEYQIPNTYKDVYNRVSKEFENYLKINADFSGGLARKANFMEKQGNLPQAKEALIDALKIDGNNNMIRSNLANLYYRSGDMKNAEKEFREVIGQEPQYGPTYYSLGLLLAELGRMGEAEVEMEQAYKLLPSNVRVLYNLSLIYDKNDKTEKAEKTLLHGLWLEPQNEELLYTLAFHYVQEKQKPEAMRTINKLLERFPNNPNYRNLLQQAEGL
ncbi:tetratricopeptide repeat protein [Flavobacteriaceae bacterium F89]|uniref:Tetratricopeptide repeat protein n=1 Tax=Cerina litoralis TaxID=2874477 RepID=A0AAE3JQX1_9FLAO|nr:tetratricopeptide repeat protein [Cerina litoralis]MCG2462344.1 tetratricopeptide repeat protein [Cerina litoralis]